MKLNGSIKILLVCLIITIIGCTNREKRTNSTQLPKAIILPEIPPMIIGENDRLNYLIQHYWDSMDFSDTTYIHHPDITLQAIVNYIDLLNTCQDRDKNKAFVSKLFSKLENDSTGKMIRYFTDYFTKYLHEPNSPTRNEDTYILVAQEIIKSSHSEINEADKERARFNIEMAMKNQVGSKATDFTYTTLSGAESSLYKFKGLYTMLFFYDPECANCKEYEKILATNPLIGKSLRNNKLEVLAICIDDNLEEWKLNAKDLPSEWTIAYDTKQTINNKKLYNIEATPTIYLLDKDKTVILKDPPLSKLFDWIQNSAILNS